MISVPIRFIQRKLLSPFLLAAIAFGGSEVSTNAVAPADEHESQHQHEDHPATGKKIASPGPGDESKFLMVDTEKKLVTIPVIATYNDVNYGMNFNGHHRGGAVYTVPKGWKVTVKFENRSPVPHSAVIVEQFMTRKPQVGEPFFDGAGTKDYLKGLVKKDEFSFVADETGKFAIACGFPAHAASGHWITLNIDREAEAPSLKFTTKKP
jgi:hypothetical protein